MKNFKKIALCLSIFALTACAPHVSAGQTQTIALKTQTSAGVVGTHTMTNTDTSYLVYAVGSAVQQFAYVEDLTFWVSVTQLTGTVSGTVTVQGSETGIFNQAAVGDWVTLVTDVSQFNGGSSLTVTGALSTNYFVIPLRKFKYIRLRYVSGGTATSVATGSVTISPRS